MSSPPAAVYVEVPPRSVAESPTASSAQAPAATEQAKPGREEKKTKKLRVRKKKITAGNEKLIKPRKGMTQKMIVIGNSCASTSTCPLLASHTHTHTHTHYIYPTPMC